MLECRCRTCCCLDGGGDWSSSNRAGRADAWTWLILLVYVYDLVHLLLWEEPWLPVARHCWKLCLITQLFENKQHLGWGNPGMVVAQHDLHTPYGHFTCWSAIFFAWL